VTARRGVAGLTVDEAVLVVAPSDQRRAPANADGMHSAEQESGQDDGPAATVGTVPPTGGFERPTDDVPFMPERVTLRAIGAALPRHPIDVERSGASAARRPGAVGT